MVPVMNPIVCMGPPNPSRKPPPQGTLHCQKKLPAVRGVRKLKFTTLCGPDVHGDMPHRAAVSDGDFIGTFKLRAGIENVCPTLQPDHELISEIGLPVHVMTLPMVPVTLLQ